MKTRYWQGRANNRHIVLLLLIIASLLLTSCVYYNTFYNAKKYYESAKKIQVPESGRPTAKAIQDYDKVIQRCTYILKEYPDSKWADDALFLLGKALFYQNRNIIQAKERFQDLLRVFPDSEFATESMIYVAKIDYRLNKHDTAFRSLSDILDNYEFAKYHPEVLLLRSEWHLEQNNHSFAQQDLNIIINEHPRSKEFEYAFLKLGMSYLDSEDYEKSKELFESILSSKVARRVRFDARYYAALSDYYLGHYEEVEELVNKLIKDEYEPTLFPRLHLLKARIFAATYRYEEAEELFKYITENNKRTLISAEACYYLAEMYFMHTRDYENALKYFNYVSSESRSSPLVQQAMGRSSVVSQILQLKRTDNSLTTLNLVQEQFKLAEYYLYVMNLPDSSLSVYRSIENQELKLKERAAELDSLIHFEKDRIETGFYQDIDSLKTVTIDDSLEITPDSTDIDIEQTDDQEEFEEELPLEQEEHIEHPDEGLEYDGLEYTYPDDYDGLEYTTIEDLEEEEVIDYSSFEVQLSEKELAEGRVAEYEIEKKSINDAVQLYEAELIPYTWFLSTSLYLNQIKNQERAFQSFERLKERFPNSKYRYAAEKMLNGEPFTLLHPIEQQKKDEYGAAIDILSADKQQGVVLLTDLLISLTSLLADNQPDLYPTLKDLYNQTLYSLGFFYYFDLNDSTAAREYIEELLSKSPQSEYAISVKQFYQDSTFVVIDSISFPRKKVIPDSIDTTERDESFSEEQTPLEETPLPIDEDYTDPDELITPEPKEFTPSE